MVVVAERRSADGVATRPPREKEAAFLAELAVEVGAERLTGWLDAGVEITVDVTHIRVAAAGNSLIDWIRRNLREPILAVSRRVLGRELPIAFEVVGAEHKHRERVHRVNWESPKAPAPPATVTPPTRKHSGRPFGTFDTFVVGSSNRIAATLLEHLVAEPGAMTPFYLHGGPGVGKTHLLEAMWCAAKQHPARKPAVLTTAEQFTTNFIASLRHGGVQSFRAKFRGISMLLLDDITFFDGKRETQTEFLHTFDALLGQGVQVVMAGGVRLKDLTMLRPEIVARLEGGMVCEIKSPAGELGTLCEIVQQMARQRGMNLSAEVCRELVACVANYSGAATARHISGALHQIKAVMLGECSDSPITAQFVQRILGANGLGVNGLSVAGINLRLSDIESVVCEAFGLQRDALRSSSRVKSVAQPRMLAMWLARKHTRLALSEIGNFFGNRSHSTVLAAQKRVHDWLAEETQKTTTQLPLLPANGTSLASLVEWMERALKVLR